MNNQTLIIVESPHKARLVADYAREVIPGMVRVRACLGHLRDLPPKQIGIDMERSFLPKYVISKSHTRTIVLLRPLILAAGRIILATDPDREGEAVAWHFTQVFSEELQGKLVQRAVFHSITPDAVQTALFHPRQLDPNLIRAAVARRVLDRIIGYQISPRLWAAVSGRDHAAGRVQTTALRLLIEQVDLSKTEPVTYSVTVEI